MKLYFEQNIDNPINGAENHQLIDKAMVFDIQRYSIHDGPGIRTLVFFKGCPLRCQWCSNPESQLREQELFFRENRCTGCGLCIESCAQRAISENGDVISIDRRICNSCGKCTAICPTKALEIVGYSIEVDTLLMKLEQDRAFYNRSNGGITLSGGEPLAQADFAGQLLKECHKRFLHTAIETCGYTPWKHMEKVLPFTDVIHFDVKHMDSDMHQKLTGKSNELILANLKKAASLGKKLIIRMPLMPGINDDENNFVLLVEFLSSLAQFDLFELVPYHKLGMGKYKNLGCSYSLNHLEVPSKERIKEIQDFFITNGIPCKKEN